MKAIIILFLVSLFYLGLKKVLIYVLFGYSNIRDMKEQATEIEEKIKKLQKENRVKNKSKIYELKNKLIKSNLSYSDKSFWIDIIMFLGLIVFMQFYHSLNYSITIFGFNVPIIFLFIILFLVSGKIIKKVEVLFDEKINR